MSASDIAGEYLWLAFLVLLAALSVWWAGHVIRAYLRRYD